MPLAFPLNDEFDELRATVQYTSFLPHGQNEALRQQLQNTVNVSISSALILYKYH
jgi:hypothetical protein